MNVSVAEKFPKSNLVEERITALRVSINLTVAFVGIAVLLIFVSWFVEYLLTGLIFSDWLDRRWFIVVGTVFIVVAGQKIGSNKRRRKLEQLFDLSSPLDEFDGIRPNSKFGTGGIRFEGSVIGPITVSVDNDGLVLWRGGSLKAYFPWSRFERVKIQENSTGGHTGTFVLTWRQPTTPPKFVVPWAANMTRYVARELIDL